MTAINEMRSNRRKRPVDLRKRFFTTGEVAVICQVAHRTVSQWFDGDKEKGIAPAFPHGFRIPGSGKDRRIPREDLIAFMRMRGIPLGGLACDSDTRYTLLVISMDRVLHNHLSPLKDSFCISSVFTAFDAGFFLATHHPDVVIIDGQLGSVDTIYMAGFMHMSPNFSNIPLIFLCDEDQTPSTPASCDASFIRPINFDLLMQEIERKVGSK